MSPDRYLSPAEIAGMGLADADTVRGWCSSGELRAFNAAKSKAGCKPRWKISQEDLDAFLAARSNRRAEPKPVPRIVRANPKSARPAIKFF